MEGALHAEAGAPAPAGDTTAPEVELVFNCFERTIGAATGAGVLAGLAAAHRFPFSRRTLLVNNVDDPASWRQRLDRLVDDGSVDRWLMVEDALPSALAATGLRRRELGPRVHWTDFALVAVTLSGPDLVCYCDPEVALPEPGDWITPAVELMGRDPRVAAANPRWAAGPQAEEKADEEAGDFLLGYGFTDQLFLVRRSEFGRPIYRSFLPVALRSPASLRYPAAFDSAVFEMRADAYMRANRRLRATHARIAYSHHGHAGSNYRPRGVAQRLRRARNTVVLKALVEARFRSPRLRLDGLLARPDPIRQDRFER